MYMYMFIVSFKFLFNISYRLYINTLKSNPFFACRLP